MSNQLEFRVWDKQNYVFCHCSSLLFISRNKSKILDGIKRICGQVYSFPNEYYEAKDAETIHPHVEIQQYVIQRRVGCNDINDLKIYEGDFVRYKNFLGEVRYGQYLDSYGFYIYLFKKETQVPFVRNVEIVGDIFHHYHDQPTIT